MSRIASLWALGSLLLILAFPDTGAAAPVVVYDNTTTPTKGSVGSVYAPDGFLPFNYYAPNEPMGDQISLAGAERVVTEFDLICSSTQETTLTALTLSFYAMDGDGGYPKTHIWSATVNNLTVDGITTVVFSVPDVVVPDTLLLVASADSLTAGLATYDPPTVGSSGNYFWDLDSTDGEWYPLYLENDPVANFGARVMATPEPATSVLLVVGGLFMAWRKRH